MVQKVLDGKCGNGDARKKAVTAAGFDYDEIQRMVNEEVARRKAEEEEKKKNEEKNDLDCKTVTSGSANFDACTDDTYNKIVEYVKA